MRCAVEGCSPVYCAICFSPSGSGCCASTSSSRIMRSITWIGLLCSSFAGIASHFTACRIRRHACRCGFMRVITCIEDLRELAKKRVARAVFDYVDRGSYSEATLRANRDDLESLWLRQRVGIDVDRRSTRATMIG